MNLKKEEAKASEGRKKRKENIFYGRGRGRRVI
jgi:hypothetical protein